MVAKVAFEDKFIFSESRREAQFALANSPRLRKFDRIMFRQTSNVPLGVGRLNIIIANLQPENRNLGQMWTFVTVSYYSKIYFRL